MELYAPTGNPRVVELYKVSAALPSDLALIDESGGSEFSSYTIEGDVLFHKVIQQYGRITAGVKSTPQFVDKTQLHCGKGRLLAADLDANGYPIGYLHLGNATSFQLRSQENKIIHRENQTGRQHIDAVLHTAPEITFSVQMESYDIENLTRFLKGVSTVVAAGTATDEPLEFYAGKVMRLPFQGLTTWTSLTDDAATPVPLVEYQVGDAPGSWDYRVGGAHGIVEFARTPVSGIVDGATVLANFAYGQQNHLSPYMKNGDYIALLYIEDDIGPALDIY